MHPWPRRKPAINTSQGVYKKRGRLDSVHWNWKKKSVFSNSQYLFRISLPKVHGLLKCLLQGSVTRQYSWPEYKAAISASKSDCLICIWLSKQGFLGGIYSVQFIVHTPLNSNVLTDNFGPFTAWFSHANAASYIERKWWLTQICIFFIAYKRYWEIIVFHQLNMKQW